MVIEPINQPELLKVTDFADAVNKSPQHIYRLLTSKLQPFVTEINGQKHIKAEAITLFNVVDNDISKCDNADDNILTTALQQTITILQREVDLLTAQLQVKDAQLKSSDDRLHEANSISMSLSERGKQLLQAAIDEEIAEATQTDTPEPSPTIPEQPVKLKWYQRLFARR